VGTHSGFTITFTPKGAGLRRATVTILTNDPAAPKFTFNIQGTAVKTAKAVNGLQVGTVIKGVGSGASNGTAITFNYTGFDTTSAFESTLDADNSAVTMALGVSDVIPGWTQGLAGIKPGETRVLVMPAALGFGANTHGIVPANSSLIYLVTATTVANPMVLVTGNAIPIALNDKTPSAADGTFLGSTVPGSLAPLSFTFKISNGSDGKVAFPVSPVVVLTSKTAANFATSDITIDPSFDFATFTVTYTPTKAGTQTAVVHVRTTDPVHPDFTFTVSGTNTPFLDLSPVAIGTVNYPASGNIVAGAATKFKVPLTVSNFGNSAVPGQTPPVQLNFYLHDTTSSADTLISSQTVTNFRGTASGKSKLVMVTVTVPVTVPTGSYQLLVKVNENAAVAETSFSNNSMLSSQVVSVTEGVLNVNGKIASSTYPSDLLVSTTLAGKLNVIVRNAGNLTLPAGQKFVLQVLAHSATGTDTRVGAATITLSSWVPGRTASFAVSASLIGGLPAGDYTLQALLAPVQPLTESSVLDNRITTNLLDATIPLLVHV
jgi:hypothetical protein